MAHPRCVFVAGTLCCLVFFASTTRARPLRQLWQNHEHPFYLDKWLEYAHHYRKHFPSPGSSTGSAIKLLEIGVQSGGSLIEWKRYYGSRSVIVGVDIDPRCSRSNDPGNGIHVVIGSQLDTTFLDSVCDKYGPFDVIIDDGGHTDTMITTSLFHMFPRDKCLSPNGGVYAVEDLHTMVSQQHMRTPQAVTHAIVAEAFLSMHAYWDLDKAKKRYSDVFTGNVKGMHLYDSLAIFEKGRQLPMTRVQRGTDSFANLERKYNKPESFYANAKYTLDIPR